MIGQKWANTQYFNPKQLPNLQCWLDCTDVHANGILPSNGTSISTWNDKSKNTYTFDQAIGGNQPIFTTNSINSKPTLSFNGTSQYLNCSNTALASSITNAMTVYLVYMVPVLNVAGVLFSTIPIPASPRVGLLMPFGGSNVAILDFCNATTGRIQSPGSWSGSANTPYIASALASVPMSTMSIYLNTTLQASGTTPQNGVFSGYTFTIGAYSSLSTGYFQGYIGEFILYNSYLTSAQQTLVYNYLKNKWGI